MLSQNWIISITYIRNFVDYLYITYIRNYILLIYYLYKKLCRKCRHTYTHRVLNLSFLLTAIQVFSKPNREVCGNWWSRSFPISLLFALKILEGYKYRCKRTNKKRYFLYQLRKSQYAAEIFPNPNISMILGFGEKLVLLNVYNRIIFYGYIPPQSLSFPSTLVWSVSFSTDQLVVREWNWPE